MILGKAVDCLEHGLATAHQEINFRALPTLNPTESCIMKLEQLDIDSGDPSSKTTISVSESLVINQNPNEADQTIDMDKSLNCMHPNKGLGDVSDIALQQVLQNLHHDHEELMDSSLKLN